MLQELLRKELKGLQEQHIILPLGLGETPKWCKSFIMLFALKADNITGNFYLCHLLYIPNMVYISDCICTSTCLYTIMACTDGMMANICLCVLLTASNTVDYWMNFYCSAVSIVHPDTV